jgi:two-component system, chemotaxis family, response regulator Rcp1
MTRVLLVEDSPQDVRFVREALSESGNVELDVVRNGNDVIPALESGALPDLILLDLNLPGCRGDQVLRAIRARPSMSRVPVVILSSSRAPEDVRRCYEEHANSYIVKPLEYDEFRDAILSLEHFWFETATLPS